MHGDPQNARVSDRERLAALLDEIPREDRSLGSETVGDRMLAAFEMFEFGVELMAANFRRRHPHASPEELERMVDDWLLERPGAELGDGPGVPVSLDRFR